MKKTYCILAFSLLTVISAFGSGSTTGVSVGALEIRKDGDMVEVAFRAEIAEKAVDKDMSLLLCPMIANGEYSWMLPGIMVQGKRAKILNDRHMMAVNGIVYPEETVVTGNGRSVDYRAQVEYREWMEGADMVIGEVLIGCCSAGEPVYTVMSEDLVLEVREEPVIVVAEPVITTGEMLMADYRFIIPSGRMGDITDDEVLFEEDRDNALTVYFLSNDYEIREDVSTNAQKLKDLLYAVRTIEKSTDSRVREIVIAGFSSPEGRLDNNDRLAWNRAESLRKYITDNSSVEYKKVRIYNGAVDWQGLRRLVAASDREWRERVLDVIDNTPVFDVRSNAARLTALMELDEGGPYRYMYNNYFPQLRQAAYIKVYFDNVDEIR